MNTRPLPPLSALEARVLAVLVEKQHTVPDSYPMSLNGLTLGCNQKTSRDPVMNATESEVLLAIDRLRELTLVIESSGGRVTRYAENAGRVTRLGTPSVALLATLMLRGPQTAAELRANCERLHRFSDVSAVEGYLEELAGRSDGALARRLPRQPGAREARWVDLVSVPHEERAALVAQADATSDEGGGDGFQPRSAAFARSSARDAAMEALQARVEKLEREMAELRAALGMAEEG